MKTLILFLTRLFRKPVTITTAEIISDNEREYFLWSHRNRTNPEVLPEELIDISEVVR